MPRRRRVSKWRRELSLSEILDEVLPPSGLVRRGPDEPGDEFVPDDGGEFEDFDEAGDERAAS